MDIADDTVARRGADGRSRRASPSSSADSAARHDSTSEGSSAGPRPSVSQLVDEIRAVFSARFHLFELEAKRAAWAAAYMLAFAVGAALLGVTAWLIVIAALMYGTIAAGVPWLLATAVAIALHVGVAFLLVRAIRSMVDNLTFAATRRTMSYADRTKASNGIGA